MKISHFPINLCIALFLCSFNASSAIVTFNFEGFVSGVENEEQVFFDPLETMGQSVTGSFTLDTFQRQFVAELKPTGGGGLYMITAGQH